MSGLTKDEIAEIRDELKTAINPLFFYDDDADGVCSYLLLKRFVKDGNGVIVKSLPKLDNKFSNKILEHNPDKIFILDIAMVEQKFVDDAKCKVI
ncbi:MAG: hypothetical protein AABY14_00095, partial [Nanoarchaeota archaeon]